MQKNALRRFGAKDCIQNRNTRQHTWKKNDVVDYKSIFAKGFWTIIAKLFKVFTNKLALIKIPFYLQATVFKKYDF